LAREGGTGRLKEEMGWGGGRKERGKGRYGNGRLEKEIKS
jgi:hypothetical protein